MPIANFGEPDPCMSIEEHFAADLPEEYTRQQLVAARARIGELEAEIARLREERAPSCQNGCLLMVKCHDVEEYYEDKSDATNT